MDLTAHDIFEQLQKEKQLYLTEDVFDYFMVYSISFFFSEVVFGILLEIEYWISLFQQFYYIFIF